MGLLAPGPRTLIPRLAPSLAIHALYGLSPFLHLRDAAEHIKVVLHNSLDHVLGLLRIHWDETAWTWAPLIGAVAVCEGLQKNSTLNSR